MKEYDPAELMLPGDVTRTRIMPHTTGKCHHLPLETIWYQGIMALILTSLQDRDLTWIIAISWVSQFLIYCEICLLINFVFIFASWWPSSLVLACRIKCHPSTVLLSVFHKSRFPLQPREREENQSWHNREWYTPK